MIRSLLLLAVAAVTLHAAELPVSRVVLYKNGLALFERSGEVKPGEPVRLEFKKSEMDDVLKTLVLDSTGSAITNLRYQLDEPLQTRLGEIGLTIKSGVTLAGLLDELRGAKVSLTAASGTIEGTIISGRLSQHAQQAQKQELTLLTTAGDLRVIDLDGVSAVKLSDDHLQKRLTDALGAYEQAQSQERKSLWIETGGKGGTLLARYLAPAPAWKSTYRLAFLDKPADKNEAMLEGWAIVENTSDADWNNVQLTVVSGRPISFISKLYEPRYVERQSLELAEADNALPAEYAAAPAPLNAPMPSQGVVGGVPGGVPGGSAGGVIGGMLSSAGKNNSVRQFDGGHLMSPKRIPQMMAADSVRRLQEATSTVVADTETQEFGELFEYRFGQPASVKAGESLLLPFVQQKISARQVYIWNQSEGAHPQRAAELKNTTGKTLDGGPVTVYAPEGYTGESLLSTLKAGDKRFITFAIDLGSKVTTKFDTSAEVVRSVKAEHGIVTTKTVVEQRTTYTISNVDAKEKALLISHPVQYNLELLSPKPEEKTAERYLFATTVPASGTTSLTVAEERPFQESISITSMPAEQIVAWNSARKLTPEAKNKLVAIVAKKNEASDAALEVQRLEKKLTTGESDENRLRMNIQTLHGVAGQQDQVSSYATQLAKKENEIQDGRARLEDARKKQATLEDELATLVENLSF
ncbi:MAG: hypothetical protein P4K98_06715 [Bryobacteraceae bacterium]|nr:hypothetical protein [Bryobacteraceae bacterium]